MLSTTIGESGFDPGLICGLRLVDLNLTPGLFHILQFCPLHRNQLLYEIVASSFLCVRGVGVGGGRGGCKHRGPIVL